MRWQDEYAAERARMVEEQIRARHIEDPLVLAAMLAVPRHRFVPPELRVRAYEDRPLPIGAGQTISQPYIVALMTALLHLSGGEVVLEVGTGSGYQAAVLARLCSEKMGLPEDAWRRDDAKLYRFTATIVGPEPFVMQA